MSKDVLASEPTPGVEATQSISSTPLLEVSDLTVEYRIDGEWCPVVQNVSFSVGHSETTAIVGESGSGKSVSALAILGLVTRRGGRIASGSVKFEGKELAGAPESVLRNVRGKEVSMIFQNPMLSLNPSFTVGDQIAEVARTHLGMNRRDSISRAMEMLEVVGIPDPRERMNDYPHMFSGGMAQRVAIAVALCGKPKLLIADEPTTALDVTVQARIIKLLHQLQEDTGVSIIFISHDLGVVSDVAATGVVMYAGEVVETGTIADLFYRPQHPYTSGLLGSIPILGEHDRELTAIPGTIPTPGNWGSECHFAARCAFRTRNDCDGKHPSLVPTEGGTVRCFRAEELTLEGVFVS